MSVESDERIGDLLDFDPLEYANHLAGQDSGTQFNSLGFFFVHEQANQLQAELHESDDTFKGTSFDRFNRIAEEEGFVSLFDIPCENWKKEIGSTKKTLFFKADEGLLLEVLHGYSEGDFVDIASLYANWEPDPNFYPAKNAFSVWTHLSWSAAAREDVLVGAIIVRVQDGLRFYLKELRKAGKFWLKWETSLGLDLTGLYRPTAKESLKALNALPPKVKTVIAPAIAYYEKIHSLRL